MGLLSFSERFLFLFGSLGLLSSGSYSYPCFSPRREQQFDQCDLLEEELEAAQSKASNKGVNLFQVRAAGAPHVPKWW